MLKLLLYLILYRPIRHYDLIFFDTIGHLNELIADKFPDTIVMPDFVGDASVDYPSPLIDLFFNSCGAETYSVAPKMANLSDFKRALIIKFFRFYFSRSSILVCTVPLSQFLANLRKN